MSAVPILPIAFLAFAAVSPALPLQNPAPAYPVFETDNLPIRLYKERRDRLKGQLGATGIALITTNPTRNRANDVDFRFHPDPNFYYLTGFDEPDSALLLAPRGIEVDGRKVTEILFVNVSDPSSETWLGYRMGPTYSQTLLGVECALPNTRFEEILKKLPSEGVNSSPAVSPEDPTGSIGLYTSLYNAWLKNAGVTKLSFSIPGALAKMRVKKSPEEIVLLRHAVDASVLAHGEALRSVEPGMREYHLQALVEYIFARNGCEFVAYPSIVGSGPNGCILHYEANRREMKNGDIIVMDVAGEYHGYAADVTRSFPVNGKFSKEQRAIYDIVLAAQDAGIAECRSGKPFRAPHNAATKVITEGLMKLGIIKSASEVGRYFMHGTSHYIGLDVHDAQGDNTLQPGYALTVEPGIYIKAGSPCDPKFWNIGVRIEDDILVTEGAPINMSGALPRKADAVEALMREKGIGNLPIRPAS